MVQFRTCLLELPYGKTGTRLPMPKELTSVLLAYTSGVLKELEFTSVRPKCCEPELMHTRVMSDVYWKVDLGTAIPVVIIVQYNIICAKRTMML